jgi:hypothetical protein
MDGRRTMVNGNEEEKTASNSRVGLDECFGLRPASLHFEEAISSQPFAYKEVIRIN